MYIPVILGRRGDFVKKLFEGDPTAWTIFGIVVGLSVGWWAFKKFVLNKQ